ncbi:Protein DOWN-REGULATED IN DIF1 11 [Cardamine amara subsp. amara]|uniref:Protein DOWN-REGULATED IN DIF1 11 n=1 Tax=Cardamine amara subsp. amara TaxID=228776 RepID=A0ABD1A5V2_CARAN
MVKFTTQLTSIFVVVVLVYACVPTSAVEESEAKQLWDTCLLKITPKCALDIIANVFGNGTISDSCCHDLVQEGRVCHDTLIQYISDRPSLRANETQYLKKKNDLWNHCISTSKIAKN